MTQHDNLQSLMDYAPDINSPWDGSYKIPWNDPEFSARMLKEHLSQSHDLASRRSSYIDEQVKWIYETFCKSQPCKILDLGCGPGLYLKNFIIRDCSGKGIDFSPASIEYANKLVKDGALFVCNDIRKAEFGEGYDLVYMIYGEFNVFSPDEIALILDKAHAALNDGGTLLIEPHTFEAVRRIGEAQDTWYKMPSGLFSARPHVCLIDNHWNDELKVALQYFHIIDIESGTVNHHRSTTKAWDEDEYRQLLKNAGFKNIVKEDDWESNNSDLFMLSALK